MIRTIPCFLFLAVMLMPLRAGARGAFKPTNAMSVQGTNPDLEAASVPLPPLKLPALAASPCSAKKILFVGDSHMAGGLGASLLSDLGGKTACVREYGLISAMASDYLRNPVCPANSNCHPLNVGYSTPGLKGEKIVNGQQPPGNWGGLQEFLEEEKNGLGTVVVELGTNDELRAGCGQRSISQIQTLLAQVSAAAKANNTRYNCAYVGPLSYPADNVMVQGCGGSVDRYNAWVQAALNAARSAGCTPIDSRKAPIQGVCNRGKVHCDPDQYKSWAGYVIQHLPR